MKISLTPFLVLGSFALGIKFGDAVTSVFSRVDTVPPETRIEMPKVGPDAGAGWRWNKAHTRYVLYDDGGNVLGGINAFHRGRYEVWIVRHYHMGPKQSHMAMTGTTPHLAATCQTFDEALGWFNNPKNKNGADQNL